MDVFIGLQNYAYSNEFLNQEIGEGKYILFLPTPNELLKYFEVKGHDLILSFIRKADAENDTLPNIHADHKLFGHKVSLASVLYLNKIEDCEDNGTAFYDHIKYGMELPSDVSDEEHDRILREDSNYLDNWKQTNNVANVPNRRVLYDGNMFHSKYPYQITKGTRLVLVCFYKESE